MCIIKRLIVSNGTFLDPLLFASPFSLLFCLFFPQGFGSTARSRAILAWMTVKLKDRG